MSKDEVEADGKGTPGRGNCRCKGSEAGLCLVGLRRPDLGEPGAGVRGLFPQSKMRLCRV